MFWIAVCLNGAIKIKPAWLCLKQILQFKKLLINILAISSSWVETADKVICHFICQQQHWHVFWTFLYRHKLLQHWQNNMNTSSSEIPSDLCPNKVRMLENLLANPACLSKVRGSEALTEKIVQVTPALCFYQRRHLTEPVQANDFLIPCCPADGLCSGFHLVFLFLSLVW